MRVGVQFQYECPFIWPNESGLFGGFYVGVHPRNGYIQSGRLLKISGFLLIIIDLKFTYWFLIAVFIWSRFRGFGSAFSSTSFVLSALRTPRTIFRNQKRFKQSSNAGIISQNIIIVFGTLNV